VTAYKINPGGLWSGRLISLGNDRRFSAVFFQDSLESVAADVFVSFGLITGDLPEADTDNQAAMEYKSYTDGIKKGDKSAIKQRDKFLERYGKLK